MSCRSFEEQVAQAAEAAKQALADGFSMQAVELNLPLIGATDLDDWPGGIRQQYRALAPMVSGILDAFAPSGKANITQRVIEDGDAVVEVTADKVSTERL